MGRYSARVSEGPLAPCAAVGQCTQRHPSPSRGLVLRRTRTSLSAVLVLGLVGGELLYRLKMRLPRGLVGAYLRVPRCGSALAQKHPETVVAPCSLPQALRSTAWLCSILSSATARAGKWAS